MKNKKLTFVAFFVFLLSFSMFAQKTTSVPVLKKNPDVQQKITPTINKEPSNAGAQNITVVTSPARNINSNSAETGYTLSSNAIGIVNREGICYNRKPNPTTSCSTITGNLISGSTFKVQLTGLPSSTTIYIRSYFTVGTVTTYGNELSFTTTSGK
jgi:hypothetical protein